MTPPHPPGPPLLLLDVDGVLNALSDHDEHLAVWQDWETGHAASALTSWPILFSPAVVERLVAWHVSARVELQWLTTWGHDANDELRRLLGLPALEVAGTYDDLGATAEVGDSLASFTPSAPDPLTGSWWKYDVVQAVLARHPGRALVWVDDELHASDSPHRRWAQDHPLVTAIGPNPRTGLSPADLDRVAAVLDDAGPASCQACGTALVPVVYGYPGGSLFESAERGEVVLGGCEVSDHQPAFACPHHCGSAS